MTTPTEVLTRHNLDLPPDDELVASIDIPILTGPQRQGDISFWPRQPLTPGEIDLATTVPAKGINLVVGEATGNAHILSPEPGVDVLHLTKTPAFGDTLIGLVHIPDGAVAYAIHTDEHSVNGIGPGTYEIRCKREQREEIERVQD